MRIALSAVVVVVALSACTSKEEDLFSLRRDNRAALDGLYDGYGGGALAGEVKREMDKGVDEARTHRDPEAAVELLKVLGNMATEVDRVAFEEQCLELGRGGRPVILNDKGKAFFARGDVERACAAIAVRAVKIQTLERELGLAVDPQRR
ncbi:MAG: hypothetical protein Q8O67_08115 [Deltaproteobacteria bacterium]|nr:hypothetical protein [Deltaproteobacteria bacterium]